MGSKVGAGQGHALSLELGWECLSAAGCVCVCVEARYHAPVACLPSKAPFQHTSSVHMLTLAHADPCTSPGRACVVVLAGSCGATARLGRR